MKRWKTWRNGFIASVLTLCFLILEKKFSTFDKIFNPLDSIHWLI